MKATKDGQLVPTVTPDVEALDLIREARVLLHRALEIQTHGSALYTVAGFGADNAMGKLNRLIEAQAQLNKQETLIAQHVVEHQYPVRLYRTANRGYIVEYGKQRKICPTWQQAAEEFGGAIFHALECEGKVMRP